MKSLKVIFPILAFAVASMSAVASDKFLLNAIALNPFTGQCQYGILVTPPLGQLCTPLGNDFRCQVDILLDGELVRLDAFLNLPICLINPSFALYYDLL